MEQVNSDVVIVKSTFDDWTGLYVDGRLKIDGHNLSAAGVLEALDIDYDLRRVSGEWLEVHGLPDYVDDVPLI
jgi:hypothetical protein